MRRPRDAMPPRRPCLVGTLSVALVLSGLCVRVAAASEQSERLYSRGLVAFHAGRFTEALSLFDQAVQTDGQDIYARYYRGVTRGRAGDFRGAIDDLRVVVDAKPDLEQAALELGVVQVEAGEYQEAVAWLQRAQRAPNLDARASMFLAMAQLRLGDTASARHNLQHAAALDSSLAVPAHYYQGVADYRERNWPGARDHFTAVKTALPESEMGREAAAFLDQIRGAQPPAVELYGEVGLQYDSNVILAPSDGLVQQAVGITNQEDGRVVVLAGGTYAPLQTRHAVFSLGYEFYQSLHFQLDDFDLQDHRFGAQFVYDAGVLRAGMLGGYDYDFLGGDSFLQQATAWPWLEIPIANLGRSELYYRMRRRDYFLQPYNGLLDSFNHAAGLRQYLYLDSTERYLVASYQFDREDPINAAGNQFAYDGNQFGGGVGWALPDSFVVSAMRRLTAELEYAYRHERYARQSNGRRDDVHLLSCTIEKALSDRLTVTAGYFGTFDNSNDVLYRYDRNIASLSLGVRF
ncbi:MAG TPA: tetratricopeptide repeat protein [Candidatus Kryptonia bacterium]|nr:tetratricopeptide repeat protein [Candidatus Kryptonia bacterium]